MAKRTPKKIKTPEQVREEANQRKRVKLVEMGADGPERGGVPEHQVAGDRVHDFAEHGKTIRRLYPCIVDRWLAEGGPGFDDPQRRAIDHCRGLWHRIGSQGKLVANLDWVGGGNPGARRQMFNYADALATLCTYESRTPPLYWIIFENVVRNDLPAGTAASALANNPHQCIAHAKNCVGFVASLIAMWEKF